MLLNLLSLPEYKEALGEDAKGISDKELEQLRDAQRDLAEVIFEQWLKDKHNNKNDNIMSFIIL